MARSAQKALCLDTEISCYGSCDIRRAFPHHSTHAFKFTVRNTERHQLMKSRVAICGIRIPNSSLMMNSESETSNLYFVRL